MHKRRENGLYTRNDVTIGIAVLIASTVFLGGIAMQYIPLSTIVNHPFEIAFSFMVVGMAISAVKPELPKQLRAFFQLLLAGAFVFHQVPELAKVTTTAGLYDRLAFMAAGLAVMVAAFDKILEVEESAREDSSKEKP